MKIKFMLKIKLFLCLLMLLAGTSCTDSSTVYVCESSNARKYHLDPHCRGLSNCSHRIVKTTLEKAKASGKTLCAWEK